MNTSTKKSRPTVGVTATALLNNNPDRVAVIFANVGANDVVIDTDNKVTTSLGVQLESSGGFANFKKSEDGELVTEAWFGIAGANQQIRIIEVVKEKGD